MFIFLLSFKKIIVIPSATVFLFSLLVETNLNEKYHCGNKAVVRADRTHRGFYKEVFHLSLFFTV